MPTPAKPTARKTTAKRGPTKAAALKALGISAEDLKRLQAIQAELDSPSVAEDDSPVETPVTESKSTSTAVYARNKMYSPFRFKTESGKEYKLAPRGFRGDFKVIHKDDLEDSNIIDNSDRGLIEVLTREEADQVITKQHTNASSHDHLRSHLRNELGDEYAPEAFKIASEEEVQGITVGKTQELDKLRENGKGIINWGEVHQPTEQVSDDPYAGMNEDQRLDAIDKATRAGGNPLAGLKVSIG